MFDQFCIVELMGHQQIAGKVSEQEIAGHEFLRVDVPEIDGIDGYTKFFSAGAVYGITPVDEETCLRAVRAFRVPPIETWRLKSPQLESRVTTRDDDTFRYEVDDTPQF